MKRNKERSFFCSQPQPHLRSCLVPLLCFNPSTQSALQRNTQHRSKHETPGDVETAAAGREHPRETPTSAMAKGRYGDAESVPLSPLPRVRPLRALSGTFHQYQPTFSHHRPATYQHPRSSSRSQWRLLLVALLVIPSFLYFWVLSTTTERVSETFVSPELLNATNILWLTAHRGLRRTWIAEERCSFVSTRRMSADPSKPPRPSQPTMNPCSSLRAS